MRKAVVWIVGLAGIAALGRWLARRRHTSDAPAPPAAADPAEELRRRLDETRGDDTDHTAERSLEERREDVHVKAQEAIDAMRESGL